MSISTTGSTGEMATPRRAVLDTLPPSAEDRESGRWDRVLQSARGAARTMSAAQKVPLSASTKDSRLWAAPTSPTQTAAGSHAPVVLVHGYAGTPHCWNPLIERLEVDGFDRVYAFSYNSFTGGLPELGQALADTVTAMLQRSGSDTVHLVGHSLGGLLVRVATEWLGLWPHAVTAVTIATPHHGCPLAWAAPGRSAWWMRSRSWTLPAPVFTEAPSPRYLNFYAARDLLLPRSSARLDVPQVTNIAVPGAGHIGTPQARAVLDTLPRALAAAEAGRRPRQRTARVLHRRAPIAAVSQQSSIPA